MLKSQQSETPQDTQRAAPETSASSPNASSGLVFATGCNCCGFILAVYTALSTFFMWSFVAIGTTSAGYTKYATFASGAFVLSATTGGVSIDENTTIPGQALDWDGITAEEACTTGTDIYENWSGKYGYCQDGSFVIPEGVSVVKAFTTLTVFLLLIAIIFGALACSNQCMKRGHAFATFFTFLAMISAIVSFATISSNAWYKDLLNGDGYMPFYQYSTTDGWSLTAYEVQLFYGPAFYTYVLVFIATLLTTLAYATRCIKVFSTERIDDIILDPPTREGPAYEWEAHTVDVVRV